MQKLLLIKKQINGTYTVLSIMIEHHVRLRTHITVDQLDFENTPIIILTVSYLG